MTNAVRTGPTGSENIKMGYRTIGTELSAIRVESADRGVYHLRKEDSAPDDGVCVVYCGAVIQLYWLAWIGVVECGALREEPASVRFASFGLGRY